MSDDPFAELKQRGGGIREYAALPWTLGHKLCLPDEDEGWEVLPGQHTDRIEIHSVKRFGFGGWVDPQASNYSFENYKDCFGLAYKRSINAVDLTCFGTFSTMEGGARIEVKILAPPGIQLERFASDPFTGQNTTSTWLPEGYQKLTPSAQGPAPALDSYRHSYFNSNLSDALFWNLQQTLNNQCLKLNWRIPWRLKQVPAGRYSVQAGDLFGGEGGPKMRFEVDQAGLFRGTAIFAQLQPSGFRRIDFADVPLLDPMAHVTPRAGRARLRFFR